MRQQGMALIEVLVAMLILAISATAVLKSSGQQSEYLVTLETKQAGYWLADAKLNEILLNSLEITELWQQEDRLMGETRWLVRWRRVPTTQAAVVALEVEVRESRSQPPVASLRTWMNIENGPL